MSDSDSDSFHTPPSSLVGINQETQNRLLTEAIERQHHEGVLSVLTGSNKWIIEMRVWYLCGRQKVNPYLNTIYIILCRYSCSVSQLTCDAITMGIVMSRDYKCIIPITDGKIENEN